MTVGDIPIAGNDRKSSRTFNLAEFSRTLIAAAQMVGDGLILITLSYVSLSFVTYIQHHETVNIEYFYYFVLTIGTTITVIVGFARSGAYDVSDAFNCVGTLKSICLLVTLPLTLMIALSIKLDTRGPVLFRQKRLGANNLPFDLLKFRSMYVEQTDPLGHQLTRAGDPRITRVGRFLRSTNLDELPQLVNVLRGEMSLVGPRPHALVASAAGNQRIVSLLTLPNRDFPARRGNRSLTAWTSRSSVPRIEASR